MMFTEAVFKGDRKKGWIEVIAGSMFSGKTEELIRRIRRVKIAGQSYRIFKHSFDNRISEDKIVSHNNESEESIRISSTIELLELSANVEVFAIDEAQFMDEKLTDVCNKLANSGKRVIIAGLDMDYKGEPFGEMPRLMALAEYVTKVHAICVKCGNLATYSKRKIESDKKVDIGSYEKYEPRCRDCY